MFALQLGVLSTFLSEPVVKALTSGAALHVLVSQLPSLLGLRLPRQIGCFALFKVGGGGGWATEKRIQRSRRGATGKGRQEGRGDGEMCVTGRGRRKGETQRLNEVAVEAGSLMGAGTALPGSGGSAGDSRP